MADGIFRIDAVVDGAGVETGVAKAKKSIAGLADEAKKSGRETTRSLGDAGKAGEQSATKLDGATKRLIGTIERQTLAMGKSKAEYYEALSAVRRLDQEALAPYIQRLREAEVAQTRASGGLSSMVGALRSVAPLLATVGITLSSFSLVGVISNTANAADALAKLSQKVGISVEDLSRLQYAAELSGVSQEKLSTAMTRLSQRMSEGSETFKKLGIETRNADGSLRNTRDVMGDLADVFSRHSDGAGKSAAAMDLMGRSGADLIPLLNAGSAGLREMGDESDRLGNTLSTDVARASEQFNDNLTRLKTGMSGLAREIAGPMIESLATLTSKLVESRAAGEGWIATIGNMLFRPEAKSALDQIAEKMQQINAELQKDPKGMLGDPAYRAALERELAAAIEQYQKLATAQGKVGESADVIKPKIDALGGGGGGVSGGLRGVGDAAKRAAEQLRNWADQQGAAAQKLADSSATSTERLREQLETIGLTSDELARYRASKLETAAAAELHAAAELESAAAILRAKGVLPDVARAYRDLAAARRQAAEELETQAGLTLQVSAAQAAAQAAKDAEREWQRTSQSIEQSLTDALMRGFESGKDFARNLRDTVVNMFKTLVLRPVIQAVVAPVAGSLTGMLGLPGTANAAQGGIGGASGVLSGLSGFGSALGVGLGAGFSSIGAAGIGGWLSAGTSLIGTGTLGGIGAGLGLLAGPVGAVLAIGGLLSSLFGDDDPRYKFLTNSSNTNPGKQFEDGVFVQSAYGNIGFDDYAKNIDANKFQETFQAIAQLDNAIAATLSPSENDRIRQALDGYVSGKDEATADYVANRLRIITDTVGGAIDQLADQFDGTSEEFVDYVFRLVQARSLIPALQDLGVALDGSSTAATQLALTLSDAFGGAQNAAQALDGYFQNYYTEAERVEVATRRLHEAFAAIGVEMPSTREAFRALVEAQDLTTESGREMFSQLVQLGPAFAELSRVIDDVFASISKSTAQSVRDIELSVLDSAGKYGYLDAEIDRLLGELTQATVPDDINRLFESVNRNITTAFGLLDSGEQERLATQFIDRLLEAESIAQSRLSVSPIEERSAGEQFEAAVMQQKAADDSRQAAREMQEAAAEMRRAAAEMRSMPDRIVVDNRLQIVASEVGVSR